MSVSSSTNFAFAVIKMSVLFMVNCQWQVRGFGEFSYESEDYTMAYVNVTYIDPKTNRFMTDKGEVGKYSVGKIENAHGLIVHVTRANRSFDNYGCDDIDLDLIPPQNESWIALVKKGRCSTDKKISEVRKLNASALVVYNNDYGNKLIKMFHSRDLKDFVSIFITRKKGEDIISILENGTKVKMYISVGTHTTYRYANINRTSVLFVSISFIVLMVISLAWLVFYYIQRFRYIHAKDLLARKLCSAAKKALTKIPVKTLKVGDRETESDFECCAVCIERYFLSDIVRTLPCKHTFHKSCVDPWLLDQRTCPMCKMDILKFYGLMFSNSQDSVDLDLEGARRHFRRMDRIYHLESFEDDSISSDVRRSSNRSTDFVILEVSNLADLGSSAGPARSTTDRSKKECGEECRTLLDTEVQSDVEDSDIPNRPSLPSSFQAESSLPEAESLINGEETTHDSTAVQSTSHDYLVILNSPTSGAGAFRNLSA